MHAHALPTVSPSQILPSLAVTVVLAVTIANKVNATKKKFDVKGTLNADFCTFRGINKLTEGDVYDKLVVLFRKGTRSRPKLSTSSGSS